MPVCGRWRRTPTSTAPRTRSEARSSTWSPSARAESLPDLRGLFAALTEAQVEFVVIGGIAIGLHGFLRATEDLDIVPNAHASGDTRLRSLGQLTEMKRVRGSEQDEADIAALRALSTARDDADDDVH